MSAAVDLDTTLAALAEPTRRGVVELLREGPRRAGDLATALQMSPPAMSRHLRVLRRHGLVDEDRDTDDARARVYRLRREPFTALRGWLDEVESAWTEQLDAFATHVRKTRTKR
ncbi:MAG: metalloregulator ArsR/SmtB family transcription factor [Deltaproteobacteria bacterium]|nr:metalloregulator ArsR/SmtB family transcription factor [Deltaproteobacteria bacterium]